VLFRAVCAVQRVCGLAALCVRQSVQGSWLQRQGRGTALGPAAGLTRRRPVCGQHTEATARGASAQRHRSASLVEEKPASREAPQHAHRGSSKRCPGKMLCPYEKELQLADGRTAHMIAAALNSSALCCLGGPRRHTSTQGTGLWACTTCCCTRCRTPCIIRHSEQLPTFTT
ncbi:Protein phosphatase PP1 regulatory subunit sds22, partial [Giardia duodenalis]